MSLKKANHTTAPHGAVVGIVPAAAGEEATTTQSQSIAAPKTHPRTPSRVDATTNSGGTIVPAEFRFTETQYEPTHNVTGEELSTLSQDDLLTGLKKQYSRTRNSHAQFGRDLAALVAFYDAVVARYSNERVSKGRNGDPTLREAFFAVGWNYEAARKMKQRYDASMAALPAYAPAPKPLQLSEGDKVKAGDGTEAIVDKVHKSAAKVDVVIQGREETVTIPVAELTKVVVSVKKIKTGDLLRDENGAEYKYEGGGKLTRTKTPTLLEKKRKRELAVIKAKQECEKEKAAEKQRQQELRKAEAARRDLEKIAEQERRNVEARAKREAKLKKQAGARTVKAKRTPDKASPNVAKKAAKKHLVKVARIGDTAEVTVTERTQPLTTGTTDTSTTPLDPDQPPSTTIGDRSVPMPNGYYWTFSKREKPYSLYKAGEEKSLGILCECKSRADAEFKIASYERDQRESAASARSDVPHEFLGKEAVYA